MNRLTTIGHTAALFSIIVWGTTYVSTALLLQQMSSGVILLIRFIMGTLCLKIICPQSIPWQGKKEIWFALAGLTGIALYFFCENTALTLTTAGNVSIILATVPMFTMLVSKIFYPKEINLDLYFLTGFLFATSGITILSLKGSAFAFHPAGDLLTIAGGIVWAFYSIILKKISSLNLNVLMVTKRTFAWGILFIILLMPMEDIRCSWQALLDPVMIGNLLFLGILASAACFATWTMAVKAIGPAASAVYLYFSPIVTVTLAYFILDEKLTAAGITGCILTIMGLLISQEQIRKAIYLLMKKIFNKL